MATTGTVRPAEPAARGEQQHRRLHPEAWLLRAALAAALAYQLLNANRPGALVAAEGLVLSFIPPLVSRLSGVHVPRALDGLYVFAIVLQFVSESFKLFEVFTYWDKLVHPGEILLATGVAAFLLLGYRDLHDLRLADTLTATLAILFGITLGALWEFVEFASDWFGNANLQKSNADTMTDLFVNDIGAALGMLLGFWVYFHRTDRHQRQEMGRLADWLTHGLGRLLARHGRIVGVALAVLVAAIFLAGWFVDRGPLPGRPPAEGQSQTWTFTPGSSGGQTAVLLGDWRADERGICRENPERPPPGSEKMGLLALAPGASYGDDGSGFTFATRYVLERPRLGDGTQMDAGVAFGVRGPDDFYLLEVSALHDVVALERYVHGRKRDQREKLVRTRGDEWHELEADVRGDRVAARIDGQPVFEEAGLRDTDGGLGLWARVTAAGCFGEARVATGPAAARGASPLLGFTVPPPG